MTKGPAPPFPPPQPPSSTTPSADASRWSVLAWYWRRFWMGQQARQAEDLAEFEAYGAERRAEHAKNSAAVAGVQDAIRADIAAGRDSGFPDVTPGRHTPAGRDG